MHKIPGILKTIGLVALLGHFVTLYAAEDEPDVPDNTLKSLDEIAMDLSHPASSLIHIRNDFEFRSYQGNLPDAGDQSSWRYVLQPIWPIPLSNGKNILFRARIPINADQPVYLADGQQFAQWQVRKFADVVSRDGRFKAGHDHLDDVSLDLAYGGVSDSGFISSFGITAVFPTSQDFSAAREQYLLGPQIALGKQADWGVIGAWATHVVDVASDDDKEYPLSTELTSVKVFFAYGLDNGWQIVSNPRIDYDWDAASSNKLALPIGGGVSKTMTWGRMPLKMDLELYYYVESPEALGPEWMMTFNLAPVFSQWRSK